MVGLSKNFDSLKLSPIIFLKYRVKISLEVFEFLISDNLRYTDTQLYIYYVHRIHLLRS